MAQQQTSAGPDLVGGRISLDFVNSEGSERNGPPEWISTYADLLAWATYAGSLSEELAGRLRKRARERPDEAAEVGERAVRFRESLYRVLAASLEGEAPALADRSAFASELGAAHAHLRLEPTSDGWDWTFEEAGELDSVLWPLALDAAELLTSGELDRVKCCAGRDCSWLFLDQSRNRSRRWCDMAVCGNRTKARRYYRRSTEDGG